MKTVLPNFYLWNKNLTFFQKLQIPHFKPNTVIDLGQDTLVGSSRAKNFPKDKNRAENPRVAEDPPNVHLVRNFNHDFQMGV